MILDPNSKPNWAKDDPALGNAIAARTKFAIVVAEIAKRANELGLAGTRIVNVRFVNGDILFEFDPASARPSAENPNETLYWPEGNQPAD
jgi:hypothetical protein